MPRDRVLNKLPKETRPRTGFPWSEWTDGKARAVYASNHGKSRDALRKALYRHARQHGFDVKVIADQKDADRLSFQFSVS